jgi:hypothetical protein
MGYGLSQCAVASKRIYIRKGEDEVNNKSRFLAIGLVLGGGIGIIAGIMMDNIPIGIVFGGGFGLVIGLAIGAVLDNRIES